MNKPLMLVLALVAGIGQPLGLAPFDFGWLALTGITLLAWLISRPQTAGFTFLLAFGYGLGLYGAGVYWVYVSIHTYGNAPIPLAFAMTALFVAFMAFMFALPLWLARRYLFDANAMLWAFPALWLLNELYRSWIFTGFPWLLSGYSQMDTWLVGWAPVTGVFGLGFICALTATAFVCLLEQTRFRFVPLALCLCLWGLGKPLHHIEWTAPVGSPKQVALVQPNIPQQHKWDLSWRQPTYQRLENLSRDHWDADWLIWPEAALPTLLSDAQPFLAAQAEQAAATQTSLVSGIIADLSRHYYNSLVVLGQGSGIYHKQRLVPFGEYVPLQEQLRGLIEFFDLPMSVLHRGPDDQSPLWLADTPVWPAVCYEIVYPDLIAKGSRTAHAILTVSNDAWFGASTAPVQHLQMARMRAIETGRPVIRATNDGLTALIDHRGTITAQGERFAQLTLRGQTQPMDGQTPFMVTGSSPWWLLALAWPGLMIYRRRKTATEQ